MKKLLLIIFTIYFATSIYATIRYVSKAGSSTPPYTSWETASDSIQKCLNICADGDTVIVGNGLYLESVLINAAVTFIGSSMDSCIIKGGTDKQYTVRANKSLIIKGFGIIGREDFDFRGIVLWDFYGNIKVSNCRITDSWNGITTNQSSDTLKNLIISNVTEGVTTWCSLGTCTPVLINSLIYVSEKSGYAWVTADGGNATILNNILIGKEHPNEFNASGIFYSMVPHGRLTVKNNLFIGFGMLAILLHSPWTDPYYVTNNVFVECRFHSFRPMVLSDPKLNSVIRNNIFLRNTNVIYAKVQPDVNYNLFWENKADITPPYHLGTSDIKADPMFIKDTLASTLQGDYHLQMYSPGIDAGDPGILDKDSTRSDIGMYGGPGGEVYQYLDLPPLTPRNIQYTANINEKKIIFSWKKNSESDFKEYHVFRDTVQGFTPDSSHLYLILPDSTLGDTAQFIDTYSGENAKYYYRIIATDNQGNDSEASDEISVVITGVEIIDVEIATDYQLYQNYPNPFNPKTVISYQLAVSCYVKVMVYDIKGELLETLVNEYKPTGYYEVEFNASKYASGIYLYRIEAIDEGGIPRFMDMKKMILIK
ncbi:MAG: T9SS type A sorting domain-containing protein [Ignavibacteriaceae bacterium]